MRPYACGLCEDTFSRSDILKRHFAKCSVRRGNPTGASHLTHSRANKRKQPSLAEMLTISMAGNTVPPSASSAPPTQSSYHSGNPTPASTPTVQSPLELQGISNLGLGTGTATYQEELQSFSNRASRANSTKRSSNGLTVNSRNTSGPNSVGNPESALSYSTNGQATPDSLTTSGAATPYSLQHDGRLPFSSDGNFNGTSNPGLDLHAVSRPHSGPAYAASSHPHIMSSTNGSRHDLDLSMFSSSGHDDFNQQYSSHHDDSPHGMAKNDHDFQYPISGPYSTFLSK